MCNSQDISAVTTTTAEPPGFRPSRYERLAPISAFAGGMLFKAKGARE